MTDSQHFSSVIAPPAPQEILLGCYSLCSWAPHLSHTLPRAALAPGYTTRQTHIRNEWESLSGNPVSQIQLSGSDPDFQMAVFYFGLFQMLCPLTNTAQQPAGFAVRAMSVNIIVPLWCWCLENWHMQRTAGVWMLPHTSVAAMSHWDCTSRYLNPFFSSPPQPCHVNRVLIKLLFTAMPMSKVHFHALYKLHSCL